MVRLSSTELITDEIILIDGLSRAGKFLLGKVVSNFESVEYFQPQHLIEQLPLFNYLSLMEEENLISYLRLNINLYAYERFIGRNLNDRNESSSILNSTEFLEYDQRKKLPDGPAAVKRALDKGRTPSFLVHECLPHIVFLNKALPQLKMINIQRHPLDISFSWFQRGWGERWGVDNLAFTPTITFKNNACPWFAQDWLEEWVALEKNPIDRVIKSIVTLFNMEQSAYNEFYEKEKILRLCYEDLFSEPGDVIQQIGKFLNKAPFENMNEVLVREGCPNKLLKNQRNERIDKVKKLASPEYYELIKVTSLEYDQFWKLESGNY